MTDTLPSRSASRGLPWLLAVAAALASSTFLYSRAESLAPYDVRGVVAGSDFTPPSGSRSSTTVASHYQHALVCADANRNGACDVGEATATTDDSGGFMLKNAGRSSLVAEVAAGGVNSGRPAGRRFVFRAAADQLLRAPVVVSPLTTEIVRMMEAGAPDYQTARQKLAARLDVAPDDVEKDPAAVTDARVRQSLLRESVILTNRFALAAKMVDRHEMTIKDAQQAVMNLEDIPRYDHLFIIMLENKATSAIKGSSFAPKINAYLNEGNQFTSYFATGNPSEPNRVALAAGDDFGIVDDAYWNCMPAGDTADAPEDPLPPEMKPCINATNHNIKNRLDMFSALSAAGMTWRVYSESMNPGRDWRLDSVGDDAITAPDTVYPTTSPVGAIGMPGLKLRMPGRLYAAKHNGSLNFQAVRSSADFARNNRTMGGGQWDAALKAAPTTPAGWDFDQLGSDLASGDVGNLNFLEPDQCDDMHGVKVQGTSDADPTLQMASNCSGDANVFRGDHYVDYLIRKIQAAPVWRNTEKRTAIVIMFDEAKDTTGFNSCCGWNPSAGPTIAGRSLGPLARNADGTISTPAIAQYNQGNKGHGTSIFGILTNQPLAPKHLVDSDVYSHISFVRTMQDMFGLADPGDDWSYMNRTKYTEKFIAANLTHLPEYAGSADPHFDAVRPMNHAYVIPRDSVQKSGFVIPPGPQRGPDPSQVSGWALARGRDGRTASR